MFFTLSSCGARRFGRAIVTYAEPTCTSRERLKTLYLPKRKKFRPNKSDFLKCILQQQVNKKPLMEEELLQLAENNIEALWTKLFPLFSKHIEDLFSFLLDIAIQKAKEKLAATNSPISLIEFKAMIEGLELLKEAMGPASDV